MKLTSAMLTAELEVSAFIQLVGKFMKLQMIIIIGKNILGTTYSIR